ncbi:MAG TPA: carboxylesterase family protein [Nitrospirota bacterium]|nr:carboxylesterase family protein [Nitrospirota bacterium]
MNASKKQSRFLISSLLVVISALALVQCSGGGGGGGGGQSESTVQTESGMVTGITTTLMSEYLGIPYAAPPVGAMRWMPPQSFGAWQGVFQATQFGSECPQAGGGDENCLFLNIYTPDVATTHAVMVWIHGGGLTSGAGSEFDPTPLVAGGGVVVVTINYRLGMLGFFAQPALDAEGHMAGNYGFMDQQFALGWVKRNVAAFGGDPARVTIFGESAGGLSVYSQLASPLAAGLFQRAIAQSGAYAGFAPDYRVQILPIATAETTGKPPLVRAGTALATAVGCSSQTAACLRAVAATTLVANEGNTFPTIDGALLTETTGSAFASGAFNRVPVMTGTNHDEYRYFVANDFTLPLTNAQYSSATTTVFGSSLTPTVMAEYPLGASPPVNEGELQLAAAGTDGIFACTARRAMMGLAQYVTVYAYEFNDESAPGPKFPGLNFPLGAYHSADVEFLFNRNGKPAPLTADELQLSQAMISYWTHFAKTGDPNSPGQPQWLPYNAGTDERQSFVPPAPVVESNFDTAHLCTSFWDTL